MGEKTEFEAGTVEFFPANLERHCVRKTIICTHVLGMCLKLIARRSVFTRKGSKVVDEEPGFYAVQFKQKWEREGIQ